MRLLFGCSKIGINLDFGTAPVHFFPMACGPKRAAKMGVPIGRGFPPMNSEPFASAPNIVGKRAVGGAGALPPSPIPAEESLCPVVSHDWVNPEYKHLVVEASPKA